MKIWSCRKGILDRIINEAPLGQFRINAISGFGVIGQFETMPGQFEINTGQFETMPGQFEINAK